jgi:hypothetical protein
MKDSLMTYRKGARISFAKCVVHLTCFAVAILRHDPSVAGSRVKKKVVLFLAVSKSHCDYVANVLPVLVDSHTVLLTRVI